MTNSDDDILKTIQQYATEAHGTQVRKFTGEPYVAHLVRVMETCKHYTNDVSILAAALLHDVLEDTDTSRRQLENFLKSILDDERAERTLTLVEELTDVYIKDDFPALNRRVRRSREAERLSEVSADAQTIKYADVIDNVKDIGQQQSEFTLVYLRECQQLLQRASDGNHDLYEQAVNRVNENLREYWKRSNVKAL